MALAVPSMMAKFMLPKSMFATGPVPDGDLHVCEIEIQFQRGATLADFHNYRTQWLNIDSFDETIRDFESQGSLVRIERKVSSNSLKNLYAFKDRASHDQFIRAIHFGDAVSVRQLSDFGFKFIRRHHTVAPNLNLLSVV